MDAVIRIFDPAMCCETGVCGPTVDPELTRMANAVFLLEKKGINIRRFNLGSEPQAFVDDETVKKALEEKGTEALPLILVNGRIEKSGSYPSYEELAGWAGMDRSVLTVPEKKKDKRTLI
ncbi:arsenical resistance operon transcriptional repressor ArsD [Alteribacter lacisalsi]|uniref:Arsenical resistance operon transcriptional repressor ArsD n=1 Tax=Alteribacter lacisalsi TaxID=2045244 RepID=A0A2W0HYQ6_9BACI|nr:arsenite efflux transporter metallochaperone ArsD [Alteribacter lacisalsi]PYZ98928.1 arsenical resistance operon transcriptional repressor ArsD [Alteribacter lacisalsi]